MKQLKQERRGSLPIAIARAMVATMLAISFLATVVPRGAASSPGLCTMSCCVGMPAHEAGSCHSGAGTAARKPQPEPEVLCGLEAVTVLAPPSVEPSNATDTSSHCGTHEHSATSADSVYADNGPARVLAHITSPCAEDCASAPVGNTGQQRTRYASRYSRALVAPSKSLGRKAPTSYDRIAARSSQSQQLQPRAPPTPLF